MENSRDSRQQIIDDFNSLSRSSIDSQMTEKGELNYTDKVIQKNRHFKERTSARSAVTTKTAEFGGAIEKEKFCDTSSNDHIIDDLSFDQSEESDQLQQEKV